MRINETPKWLSLFITAFGPKGLVVLAWWLGALHADRIRARQHSYPFLEVVGFQRPSLLPVLWKLIGSDQGEYINGSSFAELRRINGTVNGPVVIDEPSRADRPFDWDALKPLYNGEGIFRAKPGNEPFKFRGALMILGNPPMSEAMCSRFVIVELDEPQRSEAANQTQALRDLLDLLSVDGINFYDTVKAAGDRLDGLLQHTTAYFVQPHNNKRAALNHAHLHALLGVLDDLFLLPTEAREDAHIEVAAMALAIE